MAWLAGGAAAARELPLRGGVPLQGRCVSGRRPAFAEVQEARLRAGVDLDFQRVGSCQVMCRRPGKRISPTGP